MLIQSALFSNQDKQVYQLTLMDRMTLPQAQSTIMLYTVYEGFKQQNWPSNSLKVISNHAIRQPIHDFLFVFHCNYVSILHHFRDATTYLPKFKDIHVIVTMPT